MSKNCLSLERKERKYIVLEHSFEEIVEEINGHIPVYSFDGENEITQIETIYLDTKDFLLYREYLLKRDFRFKIRIRRYGRNGEFETNYVVELKVKHKSRSIKKRFLLPHEALDDFIKGEDIFPIIKQANICLNGTQKTYKLVRSLMELNQFIPVLKTAYNRVSFQKKSKKNRITVDKEITHYKLKGNLQIQTLDALVIESKIAGKTPKWLKQMIDSLSLLRQQRFSKYITGVNALYFPKRGKYNFTGSNEELEIPEQVVKSLEIIKKALNLND